MPDGDEYNTTTKNKIKQLGWCGIIKGEKNHQHLRMDDELKKVMQLKTVKSKNNDCCTAPWAT